MKKILPGFRRCLLTRLTLCTTLWAMAASVFAAVEPVRSYIVVDHHSGVIVAHKNANQKVPVASLTKIATAAVVLDWLEGAKIAPGQEMVVPATVSGIGGANRLGLMAGDRISIRDALYGALIGSDNFAAETLAYHVGKDLLRRQGKAGRPILVFVKQMNVLATRLGMRRTKFRNPHGLDHVQQPYSCAADMARVCDYVMKKASFRFYVSQKKRRISFTRNGQKRVFQVKNTNKLLGAKSIDGVKTGMTRAAGGCLIVSATRPTTYSKGADGKRLIHPHRLVVVVLAARDRFGSASELLDVGWRRYDAWNADGRPTDNDVSFLSRF